MIFSRKYREILKIEIKKKICLRGSRVPVSIFFTLHSSRAHAQQKLKVLWSI